MIYKVFYAERGSDLFVIRIVVQAFCFIIVVILEVCVVDFDIGLRNLDIHLGAERRVSGVEIVSGGFDGARHVAEFQLAFSLAQPAGVVCDADWRQAAREKCGGAQLRTAFDGVAARYWRVLVVGAKQAGQPAAIARIALRIARDAPLLVRQRSLQVDEDEL